MYDVLSVSSVTFAHNKNLEKQNSNARVLTFCNVDAGVIDQLEIAKVLSQERSSSTKTAKWKALGFPRFEDLVSNFTRLVTDRSALIATIGWLKTHYPSFRIIDPVSNIRRLWNPKTFLRLEERVFGSVGNMIASNMLDQTARYNSPPNLLK